MIKNAMRKLKIRLKGRRLTKKVIVVITLFGALFTVITGVIYVYEYIDTKRSTARDLQEQFEKLDVGTSLEFVKSIFGEPFIDRILSESDYWSLSNDSVVVDETRPLIGNYKENIFIHTAYYLQTITDPEGKLALYSITLRDKTLKLSISEMQFEGSEAGLLGKTSFDKICDYLENGFTWWGMHYSYSERCYFGKAGKYNDYIFSASPYGIWQGEIPKNKDEDDVYGQLVPLLLSYIGESIPRDNPDLVSLRAKLVPNTITVIGRDTYREELIDYIFFYGSGPSIDVIYTMPR